MSRGEEIRSNFAPIGLWLVLGTMVMVRALALWLPTMHLWGLNAARFLPSPLAWGLLALPAMALVPRLSRACTPGLEWLARGPRFAVALTGITLGLLLALPDRLWFVGDYLLRMGILTEPKGFATMFPQALPLDLARHYWLPRTLASLIHVDPSLIERGLGCLEGALLALLAVHLARVLELRGAAAVAVAAVVLLGGYVTLFTGYGKPTIEVCLLTASVGVFGLELLRHNRGALAFGLSLAAALALHRAAWSMIPGALVGWGLWFRLHGRHGGWRSPANLIAIAIPLVTIAALLPRLLHLFFGFDVATNFSSQEVRQQGGVLRAAFSGLKLLDIANVVLLLCPLALAVPVLGVAFGRRLPRPREPLFLAAMVASYVPSLFFVYVTQGPFRDWDVFAGAGAAISILSAWWIGETLREAPRFSWLALPVVLGVLIPSLELLGVHHDPEAGLARTYAFLSEPPRRTPSQRLATLDFLGLRAMRLHRWAEAASAYRDVAAVAPHGRALEFWGVASALDGRFREAEDAFGQLAERVPDRAVGWAGLWMAASFRGDTSTIRRARARLEGFTQDGPELRELQDRLDRSPELRELFQSAQRREEERRVARP